jgi:hypothetical protein
MYLEAEARINAQINAEADNEESNESAVTKDDEMELD